MSGAIHPLPQYASTVWFSVKAQGQLYLYNAMEEYWGSGGIDPLIH